MVLLILFKSFRLQQKNIINNLPLIFTINLYKMPNKKQKPFNCYFIPFFYSYNLLNDRVSFILNVHLVSSRIRIQKSISHKS